MISDIAIQKNLESIFTYKFLHFMVEDHDINVEQTEYLPFLSLIRGPNYEKLFEIPHGIELY